MVRTQTYTPDFTTTRDQVRLKIGDPDSAGNYILYDDEIEQAYAEGGSIIQASILACRWMIAKLASSQYDKNIDGLSTKRSQRVAQIKDLLGVLQAEALTTATTWTKPSLTRVSDTKQYPKIFHVNDADPATFVDEETGIERKYDYSDA